MKPAQRDSTVQEFAEPDRSVIVGGSALVSGLMLTSVVLQLSFDQSLPMNERWVAGGLGGLLALSAFVAAYSLMTPRGGMWLDTAASRLGIGITSQRDVWWLGPNQLMAIACERREISSDVADFAWRTYARLSNGVELVLVETHERDIAEAVADELKTRIGLNTTPSESESVAHESGATTLRVTRGVALHGALFVAGFTLTVLGGALYSQVEAAPGFAFFVAPLLLFTGIALLAVVIVKRIATEHLEHHGGLWSHSFGLGKWRWSTRHVSAPQPRWSLHIRPARGARLELEGQDGTLVIGHGATTLSRASIADLATLPERFRR